MKTRLVLTALLLAARLAAADTLTADTAVFVQADAKSPVLARLKSGDAVTYVGEAPNGWRRVEVAGPFQVYALAKDIAKDLSVKAGANLYLEPEATAPVLGVAEKGDKSEVTGLAGARFCQIRIEKKIQGFIATGLTANTPAPGTGTVTPAPVAVAPNPTGLGHPVPVSPNSADLPRFFSGTLVLARRAILNPNPPYDFQLTDSSGRRFAYVDTRRLVAPDRIDAYLGLVVTLSGTVRNTVDGKDLVVEAESIQRN